MMGSTEKLSYSVVLPKNGANPTTSWPITALSRACKPSDKARLYIKRRNKELGDVQVCTMYIVWSDPLQKSKQTSVQSDAYKAETRRHHLITFTTMLLPVLVGWFTSLKAENMNVEKGSKVKRIEKVRWNFSALLPAASFGQGSFFFGPPAIGFVLLVTFWQHLDWFSPGLELDLYRCTGGSPPAPPSCPGDPPGSIPTAPSSGWEHQL